MNKIFAAVMLTCMLSSCTKNFQEMNTNPNTLVKVPYKTLLTNAIVSTARANVLEQRETWTRYQARVVYNHDDKYRYDGSSTNPMFVNAYSGYLKDLSLLISYAAEINDNNTVAAGMILEAYSYQNLTDQFGDIPYSEALKGDSSQSVIFPKYDSQQSIYMDLIAKLKQANNMRSPGASIGSADVLFGGDMDRWKIFANSLLLRIYMRMSLVDPATAKSGIEEIMANPVAHPIVSSVDEAIFMNWLANDANYRSPYWINPVNYDIQQVVLEESIVNFLKERDDPRLPVYAQPAKNSGEYRGMVLGMDGQGANDYSTAGIAEFRSGNSPIRMIRYSDVLFILAEAALNGWEVGMTAENAYNAAITASFEEYDLEPGNYLSQPLVDFNGGVPQRQLIGEQKWAALFLDGLQGWSEVRRTGYPEYVADTEPMNTYYPGEGTIKRMAYPNNEFIDNEANIKAALAAQPGIISGKLGAGVWWDIR